jgi:hypothetical protein
LIVNGLCAKSDNRQPRALKDLIGGRARCQLSMLDKHGPLAGQPRLKVSAMVLLSAALDERLSRRTCWSSGPSLR